MPTLAEIENKIDEYLLLPDKSVIKVISAFVAGCKLPLEEPPWLFIVTGSSGGKTAILNLFEEINGYHQIDDLTNNALLSGMKRHDTSASLLDRMEKDGFLVFKDFTTMLSKHKEEVAAIMGKLRVVFDGSMVRATGGQVEQKEWRGKLGLLAACTTSFYSKTEDFADMGQRSCIYYLEVPDDYAIGEFLYNNQRVDRKAKKLEIQGMVKQYIENIPIPKTFDQMPEIDRQTWKDLEDIAHLTVSARSPVERDRYSRTKDVTMNHAKESMGRLFNQLKILAYGLMLQNPDQKLTDGDRKILYKIGLDCIDPRRRGVLQALTKYSYGGDYEQIADAVKYKKVIAERFIDDLFYFGMLERHLTETGHGKKFTFKISDKYQKIMSRFENIVPETKALPDSEDQKASLPIEPGVPWEEVTKHYAAGI